jgi:hydrogenase maturation protein HypF
MGRLFDGVASLLIGATDVSYEGEAAVRLEAAACKAPDENWWKIHAVSKAAQDESFLRADWRPMIRQMVEALRAGCAANGLARRFHHTIAAWAASSATAANLGDVVLTGGCFQNLLLAEATKRAVQQAGMRAHLHQHIPPGDGGLAAGQLAVAVASIVKRRTGGDRKCALAYRA